MEGDEILAGRCIGALAIRKAPELGVANATKLGDFLYLHHEYNEARRAVDNDAQAFVCICKSE
jgi:hypothetical protein